MGLATSVDRRLALTLEAGLAALMVVAIGCHSVPTPSDRQLGSVGGLVVLVVDSLGNPRQTANAYFLEDPRITSDVVSQGGAGAWTDVNGMANLGEWRAGQYTLRVRLIGLRPVLRHVVIEPARTDTVRVVMREPMSLR